MPVTSTLPPEKYKIFTDSRNEFRALPSVDERNALIDRRKAECIRLYGPFEDDEEGVNQYYYNQTYTKNKKKKNKPSKRSDSSEPSTSQVLLNKAWTGRDVYWAANGSRGGQINEEVNEERTANGVSHLRHVGLLNKALAKGWGELPPEEKGIWDKEADNMNADETKKILEAPDAVVNQEIEAAFEKLRKKFGVVYFAFFVAVPDPKGEPLLIHRSNAPSKFDNINRTQVGERFFQSLLRLRKGSIYRCGTQEVYNTRVGLAGK
ncbi:hypothetical protein BDP27DRAFT_758860 [Rhodocollybia butyracea]|uniref:Uncharacterized protein n=1 Tax=Rhodocollybia butyracea TaxID=206335 RepID=A0A9P5PTE5_9AGAR|nr:hypothetical protein BDP27DRAFT_758860 [Rhodocollybia butyracea]